MREELLDKPYLFSRISYQQKIPTGVILSASDLKSRVAYLLCLMPERAKFTGL